MDKGACSPVAYVWSCTCQKYAAVPQVITLLICCINYDRCVCGEGGLVKLTTPKENIVDTELLINAIKNTLNKFV